MHHVRHRRPTPYWRRIFFIFHLRALYKLSLIWIPSTPLLHNLTQMECHTPDLSVYHLVLWAQERARSHCALKFQWRIPDNPMCRITIPRLFFRESCWPDAAQKCQKKNGALPAKIPESWMWEPGDRKCLGFIYFFGMVLSTLKNKVMFI